MPAQRARMDRRVDIQRERERGIDYAGVYFVDEIIISTMFGNTSQLDI
jgi:hypothetical protein